MFTFLKLPYCLAFWAASGTMAPAMGPIVAGFSVSVKGWRWSLWENLWLAAPVFLLLLFCLPETSSDNILLRRAARLRKVTGNKNIRSQSEITQQHMSAKEMAFEALVKPWEMNILDPAVLFTTLYASLCYSIFYTFFEAFPLVFPAMYDFSSGELGLAFLSIPIGVGLTIPVCLAHYAYYVEPGLAKNGAPEPEVWLRPGLIGNFLVPIGLFIFGEYKPLIPSNVN
jgi:DHA1 family multidrug resistance protein-like MFS transporter